MNHPANDYFNLQVALDRAEKAEAERDVAIRERNEARDALADMVEKAAANSLDGYRELGARAAAAENEHDTLSARVKELEEALRFYARPWVIKSDPIGAGLARNWYEPPPELSADTGARARAALNTTGT